MPSFPAPHTPDPVEDGDSLPAVGKVWNDGPKRSLSEIMAAAARQREAAAAAPARPTPARATGEIAAIWSATLQQVHEQLGTSVHVPLLSGEVRKDGEQVIVRFTGPFSAMARYLDKHRDAIQQILSEIAGASTALRFEIDETAPARPAPPATPPTRQDSNPQAPTGAAAGASPAGPSGREGVPLTPELRDALEKDPLIRAVLEQLNGSIVKVEQ